MQTLEQIQRGIDFIEDHLHRDIRLAEVTRTAGVSHWHFQRMFKALTGETLKAYIRSRRLANARMELLNTQLNILEIALNAGFHSQAAFSRAFKKAFGVPPGQYRSLGDEHLFLEKLRIDTAYLEHIHQRVSHLPNVARVKARHMVGLSTQFFSVDSERNNIGEKLPPLWGRFLPRLNEIAATVQGTCYGVVQQSGPASEQLEYTAAIEVLAPPKAQELPSEMVYRHVPETTYATFVHTGEATAIDHTVNYIYSAWLGQSGYRHSYGADLEIYGAQYSDHSPDSVMHYAIPVLEPT